MSLGVSGEKPKKPYQQLGPDVEISTKGIDSDKWADERLREVGKAMTQGGMEYIGSCAIHWYKTDSKLALDKYDLDIKQQFCVGDMNVAVLSTGISAFVMTVQRDFMGRTLKSTDSKDKR